MGGGREVTENAGYWWRFSGWVGWNVHPLDTAGAISQVYSKACACLMFSKGHCFRSKNMPVSVAEGGGYHLIRDSSTHKQNCEVAGNGVGYSKTLDASKICVSWDTGISQYLTACATDSKACCNQHTLQTAFDRGGGRAMWRWLTSELADLTENIITKWQESMQQDNTLYATRPQIVCIKYIKLGRKYVQIHFKTYTFAPITEWK